MTQPANQYRTTRACRTTDGARFSAGTTMKATAEEMDQRFHPEDWVQVGGAGGVGNVRTSEIERPDRGTPTPAPKPTPKPASKSKSRKTAAA